MPIYEYSSIFQGFEWITSAHRNFVKILILFLNFVDESQMMKSNFFL